MTNYKSNTLYAVLATARAIQLQTKDIDLGFVSIPTYIPSVGDIMDIPVIGDGLDLVGDGINIVQDGVETGLDYTLEGLEVVADETVGLIEDIPVIGGTLVDIGEITGDVLTTTYEIASLPFSTLENLTGIPLTPEGLLDYTWNLEFIDDAVDAVDFVTSGDIITATYHAPMDFVNYVGDGENWEAIGKTLLMGGGALISGDPETAAEVWGNKDLYDGDTWNKFDEQKRQLEESFNAYKANCDTLYAAYLTDI